MKKIKKKRCSECKGSGIAQCCLIAGNSQWTKVHNTCGKCEGKGYK